MSYEVKDSGARQEYPSGMVRDTQDGKPDYSLIFDGPLVDRLAEHLTKGADKYGRRNWQLANSKAEMERFRASAVRHFRQWLRGDTDEDHFSASVFNMNAVEYVKGLLAELQRASAEAGWNYQLNGFTTSRMTPPATTVPPVTTAWPHMRDTLRLRSAKKPNETGCCGDPGDCKCG